MASIYLRWFWLVLLSNSRLRFFSNALSCSREVWAVRNIFPAVITRSATKSFKYRSLSLNPRLVAFPVLNELEALAQTIELKYVS